MADPQFGMFASISEYTDDDVEERRARGLLVRKAPRPITGYADETRLYTAAIEATNRLNPAFAVICGDLVHDAADQSQIDELIRITSTLDGGIPMRLVSGNHDVGKAPTPDSLALYRQRFGLDNYSFDHGDCHFVVINSSVAFDPVNVPARVGPHRPVHDRRPQRRQKAECVAQHLVLFTHHPLFQEHAAEADSMWTVPIERRDVIVRILRDFDASAVFAGHLHKNVYADDAGLMMVTTGAVGYPLGPDPSGIRIVHMQEDAIRHRYYGMNSVPRLYAGAGKRRTEDSAGRRYSSAVLPRGHATGLRSRPSTTVIVSCQSFGDYYSAGEDNLHRLLDGDARVDHLVFRNHRQHPRRRIRHGGDVDDKHGAVVVRQHALPRNQPQCPHSGPWPLQEHDPAEGVLPSSR